MTNKKVRIFFFFPLASIGGTELVHADILAALKDFDLTVFIRYRGNVWKNRENARSAEAKKEGSALLTEYRKYARVLVLSDWFEAKRFARILKSIIRLKILNKINRSSNPLVIFWHRESVSDFLPSLESHVRIIDIVHNAPLDISKEDTYLNMDIVLQLYRRAVVTDRLKNLLGSWNRLPGLTKK